ncbi:MAG: dethiobiotin synthase [Verrucomicrobiota bacterium]|nr:dethiobiotin synthase [Verrucomicrobiota bacterium]
MKSAFFITGTDTNVGKTFVTCLILDALKKRGIKACGYKPLLCGERSDAFSLFHSGHQDGITIDDINPIWMRPPAAPYTASMIENRLIDLGTVFDGFHKLQGLCDCVLIEGVGGWRVPIRKDFFLSDLAEEFSSPVIVVARPNLGTINHSLLTVESIRKGKLPLAGLILNQSEQDIDLISANTNPPILEELTGLPILARIDYGQREPDLEKVLELFL